MSKHGRLTNTPAHKLRELLESRQISSVELTKEFLNYLKTANSDTNAVITICEEEALAQAEVADDRLRGESSTPSPLTGIPILLKDNISTRGVKTTAGSKMLEDYVPPYDATVVKKLKDQGMVIIGKANMDEFAMGASTENSYFDAAHNPWDPERVPGGSSGGSAAAVAIGDVPMALGSDTGGSIRQPASLCGIVGMKPSYGLVSRYGLIAFGSSLDQIGPLTHDVRDCAELLNTISGYDELDSTSSTQQIDNFCADLDKDVAGLKLGIPKELIDKCEEQGVLDAFDAAIQHLRDLGCEIKEISLPLTLYSLSVYYIVAPAEASANLARFDGIKYGFNDVADSVTSGDVSMLTRTQGFGDEVKRRIFLGTYVLSRSQYDAFYKKAQAVKQAISAQVADAFKDVDLVVTPTSLTTAFKLGDNTENPLAMYLCDLCTVTANVIGAPAISIPCGFSSELPVGLQFMGPPMSDQKVLQVANAYQRGTDWHRRHPS